VHLPQSRQRRILISLISRSVLNTLGFYPLYGWYLSDVVVLIEQPLLSFEVDSRLYLLDVFDKACHLLYKARAITEGHADES